MVVTKDTIIGDVVNVDEGIAPILCLQVFTASAAQWLQARRSRKHALFMAWTAMLLSRSLTTIFSLSADQ